MRVYNDLHMENWVSIFLYTETIWYNDSCKEDILKNIKRK